MLTYKALTTSKNGADSLINTQEYNDHKIKQIMKRHSSNCFTDKDAARSGFVPAVMAVTVMWKTRTGSHLEIRIHVFASVSLFFLFFDTQAGMLCFFCIWIKTCYM